MKLRVSFSSRNIFIDEEQIFITVIKPDYTYKKLNRLIDFDIIAKDLKKSTVANNLKKAMKYLPHIFKNLYK